MKRALRAFGLGALALAMSAGAACSDSGDGSGPLVVGPGNGDGTGPGGPGTEGEDPGPTELDNRVIDYNEALKTASVKLLDIPPTLEQIRRVQHAADQQLEYELLLDEMFDDVRFNRRMIRFWRDTFKQGGGALDTAPVFAARVMVEGRPFSELFTAQTNTCPTYDSDNDVFVDGDCDNNVPQHAGVLTNPGSMRQFYGNMAFRRVRWIQEVFACSKFPAEYADAPVTKGAGQYTSPWPFESISNEPIDFQDTSAVICANCHTTMNHIAPLFANFDEDGVWQGASQVQTPIAPDPVTTELSHWLPAGEQTAWRNGVAAPDLPALGQAMAEDALVKQCVVARLWNFAMSKEDIVDGLATVPASVIEPYVQYFIAEGLDMKETLRVIMKSEDFVSY